MSEEGKMKDAQRVEGKCQQANLRLHEVKISQGIRFLKIRRRVRVLPWRER